MLKTLLLTCACVLANANVYTLRTASAHGHLQPTGPWVGKALLPEKHLRDRFGGVPFVVHHAPKAYEHWINRTVVLRWGTSLRARALVEEVTKDVHLDPKLIRQGEGTDRVPKLPTHLHTWERVSPLESLATLPNSAPHWFVLNDPLPMELGANSRVVEIETPPVQVAAPLYALVQFQENPHPQKKESLAAHYQKSKGEFSGPTQALVLKEGVLQGRSEQEISFWNKEGWFAFGEKDSQGAFHVHSLVPRARVNLTPQMLITDRTRTGEWLQVIDTKQGPYGEGPTVYKRLLHPHKSGPRDAMAQWKEGDRALVIRTTDNPTFSLGVTQVVVETLSGDLIFNTHHHTLRPHNPKGLLAGAAHWSMPQDASSQSLGRELIVKWAPLARAYTMGPKEGFGQKCPLDEMEMFLGALEARFRIGDGLGATLETPLHSIVEGSVQALLAAIDEITVGRSQWQPETQKKLALGSVNDNSHLQSYFEEAEGVEALLAWRSHLNTELQARLLAAPPKDLKIWHWNSFRPLTWAHALQTLQTFVPWLPQPTAAFLALSFLQQGAPVWVMGEENVVPWQPPHTDRAHFVPL